MDECFRFLINVDQCLNMSMYDIFFYKLKNERKFHLNQLHDDSEKAFLKAFQDVHMYLNKYPYHFKEYQIIITMCCPPEVETREWDTSLLRRLLQINQGLHDAQICIDSDSSTDSALNLFLFHEAEVHQKPDLRSYLSSDRLENDCRLLLEYMDGCVECSKDDVGPERLLEEYRKQKPQDDAVISVMERFLETQSPSVTHCSDLLHALAEFFRKLFVNFKVMELLQTRNLHHAPRKNTGEMLRVVEYITSTVEYTQQHLSTRCFNHWNAVKNRDLEIKYSDMLFVYEQMLEYAHEQLELEPLPVDRNNKQMPEDFFKSPDGIGQSGSAFPKVEQKQAEMIVALDHFLRTKQKPGAIRASWQEAYSAMSANLQELDIKLKNHADELGRKYSRRVEKRKKEALRWKGRRFFADGITEGKIAALEKERASYMKALQDPDMTPSLKFEDQARAEAALERANAEIMYYLDCLNTCSKSNSLRLFCGAFLTMLLHYAWLQPFSFNNFVSGPVVFLTALVMALGMGLAGLLPGLYYRRAIKSCAFRLKKELDDYVPEYYGRTEKFREYINTLDQLDRISKLITIYRHSLEYTRRLERGCMWHKTQIKDHLIKLGAFRSLIDSGNGRSRTRTFDKENCPTAELLTAQELNDIEQCSLYWPQGR